MPDLPLLQKEIQHFLGNVQEVLYIGYAGRDPESYGLEFEELGFGAGYKLRFLHREEDKAAAVRKAEAFYVDGGNTNVLKCRLEDEGLVDALREAVLRGIPYMGLSAGSILPCPNIRTCEDWPVRNPVSFSGLGVIPFQIKPHYFGRKLRKTFGGETPYQRIREYLAYYPTETVVGLREGAILVVADNMVSVRGRLGIRVFRKHSNRGRLRGTDYYPGGRVDFLLNERKE